MWLSFLLYQAKCHSVLDQSEAVDLDFHSITAIFNEAKEKTMELRIAHPSPSS